MLVTLAFGALGVCLLFILYVRSRREPNVVAFFHPYCNAGGGGERVLWCAINAMIEEYGSKNKDLRFVVYTGDRDARPEQILAKARRCFNLDAERVEFVYLRTRFLVDAKYYPVFTMICQALGGFVLGLEAVLKLCPGVFIDSMGYAFTLPLFSLAGSKVACYVHYPTISCDMIGVVDSGEAAHNNARWIASSSTLSSLKKTYYKIFARIYGCCGWASSVVMVNGSWTMGHIKQLWVYSQPRVVFPPCNVEQFLELGGASEDQSRTLPEELLERDRRCQILSVGQIRPEKNYRLQLDALALIKERMLEAPEDKRITVNLVIVGGCRNEDDENRVKELKEYSSQLGLIEGEDIQWHLNAPFDALCQHLKKSLIGFHSMWNEHFGIAVVDGLASGNIMVAHNSGGPKLDIVQQKYGFLASTPEEYADKVVEILRLTPSERASYRTRARAHAKKFSEANFASEWNDALKPIMI
uniref:GDP-Man:Man(3)GlcNAc(2)-PP-Dol alpha-1,2-mannosyltransferase n=1 Tax=Steinernema glaseri TaxID=37863 RepID=A0A1I7ZL66_9BILA